MKWKGWTVQTEDKKKDGKEIQRQNRRQGMVKLAANPPSADSYVRGNKKEEK